MQVADPVQPFVAPKIGGRLVHWYSHADRQGKPAPALVQSVTPYGALTLTVFPLNHNVARTLHGVLHINDPKLKKLEEAAISNGGWDLTPEDRDAQQDTALLETQLKALAARVEEQSKTLQMLEEMIAPAPERKAKK